MSEKTYRNCQSCGMPFRKDPKGGGTERDGTKSKKYCSHCYENGAFVGGDLNLEDFLAHSKKGMIEGGLNPFLAWLFSRPFMVKHLERWKQ